MTYAYLDLVGLPDLPGSSHAIGSLKIDEEGERVWLIAIDRLGRTYYKVRHERLVDGQWVIEREYNA